MKKALFLLSSALALFILGSTWLSLFPAVPADLGGVRSLDSTATRVRIPVGEADSLDGWLIRGTKPAIVVLAPGYARDHRRVWRYAQFLRHDGYSLLALDFRSARMERRKPTTLGVYERQDLDAALAWIAAQQRWKRTRVGLFGESLGGSTVLAAAAADSSVDAVVADCPFATGEMAVRDGFACRFGMPAWPLTEISLWLGRAVTRSEFGGLDTRAALAALGDRPVLLIQTSRGDRFAHDQVRQLENAAGPGAEGWTVADSRHTEVWIDHRREYETRVRGFFARHLLGARVWTLEPAAAAAAGARR